jgi:hypothetical protein
MKLKGIVYKVFFIVKLKGINKIIKIDTCYKSNVIYWGLNVKLITHVH